MELIIFIGIPASGKTTFYVNNFLNSHVRISLDLLRTRNKEKAFLNLSFQLHQRIAIDNTNVKRSDRAEYIKIAKENKYKITGYYFITDSKECLQRNLLRKGKDQVQEKAIYIKNHQLEKPKLSEGFDNLFAVTESGVTETLQ